MRRQVVEKLLPALEKHMTEQGYAGMAKIDKKVEQVLSLNLPSPPLPPPRPPARPNPSDQTASPVVSLQFLRAVRALTGGIRT